MRDTRDFVMRPEPPRWLSRAALGICVGGIGGVIVVGTRAPAPVALVVLAIVFVALVVLLLAESRRRTLDVRTIVVATGVLFAVAVATPPVMSRDLWSYALYGRITVHYHASPYTDLPIKYRHDPIYHEVSRAWQKTPSVYGPVFTWLSAGGMALAGARPLLARLFFQGLAALSIALAMWLVYRRTRDPVALAMIGLNPVIVITVVNAGHNDALLAVGLLGAVLLAAGRRTLVAAAVVGLAALVKITAGLAMIGLLLWVWRVAGFRRVVSAALVCGAVVLAGYGIGGGRQALHPLQEARLNVTGASLWNQPRMTLTHQRVAAGERGHVAGEFVRRRIATIAGLLVFGLAAVAALHRRHDATPALAMAASLLAYTLLGTYVLTWYLGPVIVLSSLSRRSTIAWLAMAQGALLELAYVPDVRFLQTALNIFRPHGAIEHLQLDLRAHYLPQFEILAALLLVVASLWPTRIHRPHLPHRPTRRVASAGRG